MARMKGERGRLSSSDGARHSHSAYSANNQARNATGRRSDMGCANSAVRQSFQAVARPAGKRLCRKPPRVFVQIAGPKRDR